MDLQALLEKTVTGLGFELVDIEQSARGRTLRVFIDQPAKERGVDVEDCAMVSNQLSRLMAVENIDYDRLEVSSPGLDRVLRKPSDFVRFAGCDVQIKLRVPLAGRRNFSGNLIGHEEGGKVRVRLETGEVLFDLAQIDKCRLVPRL